MDAPSSTARVDARRNASTARLGTIEDGDCYLCGGALAGFPVSREHVLPRSRFTPGFGRKPLVHVRCNAAKADMTVDEFVALCGRVVRHWRKAPGIES